MENELESSSGRLTLALCSGGILSLELAIIRWMSGQIRVFAYFTNVLLMAAFLGIGIGVLLGKLHPELRHAFAPSLALLSTILAFSGELHLLAMRFPDASVSLWGSEQTVALPGFVLATGLFVILFWIVTAVFAMAAIPVGYLFSTLPALPAYVADLSGSIAGILVMTLLAALRATPPVWIAVACLPFLVVSRRWLSVASAAVAVLMAAVSIRGALYSPYSRLDLSPDTAWRPDEEKLNSRDWNLMVNRDFHQEALDLSELTISKTATGSWRRQLETIYRLPFRMVRGGRSALVVGAGITAVQVRRGIGVGRSEIARIGRGDGVSEKQVCHSAIQIPGGEIVVRLAADRRG